MKTQEQIAKLKTLQESLDTLSDSYKELVNSSGNIVLKDVADGKKRIAEAINTKGGSASADESFQQLAEDIQTLPYAGISSEGIVQEEPFSFLEYITTKTNSEITEINSIDITAITRDFAFTNNKNLRKVELANLVYIDSEYCFSSCDKLEQVTMPNLERILSTNCFSYCTSLSLIELLKVESLEAHTFTGCNNLIDINCLNCVKLEPYAINEYIKNLTLGKLQSVGNMRSMVDLRNFTIGQGTDINLPFQTWTAKNVINEGQSGIDELNSNLYTNLLTKLYDHSTDGQTRTLRLGWLAHVTQENIDYANSKGWTLTT